MTSKYSATTALALVFLVAALMASASAGTNSKIAFWDSQRRGANCFNEALDSGWFIAAKQAGIGVVRLVPNKWKSERRDFLIGDVSDYRGLVQDDLRRLLAVLDMAERAGLKVVVSTLSLPGFRWRQQNGDQFDLRLWKEPRYLSQAANFWKDLASALKGHPAVVGYNIVNEPIPERTAQPQPADDVLREWYEMVKGTPADLNRFYDTLMAAIRAVDSVTPIVLDAGKWAAPGAFAYLRPANDAKVLYSFHMYEPFEYTNRKANGGRIGYPGQRMFPRSDGSGGQDTVEFGRHTLEQIIGPVAEWQQRFGIPPNRILVGEFGCNRLNRGVEQYLADLIRIFNGHSWHWAFYSFREDTWDGMDYELGTKPLGEAYWDAKERGENPPVHRFDNPVWKVLREGLTGYLPVDSLPSTDKR